MWVRALDWMIYVTCFLFILFLSFTPYVGSSWSGKSTVMFTIHVLLVFGVLVVGFWKKLSGHMEAK